MENFLTAWVNKIFRLETPIFSTLEVQNRDMGKFTASRVNFKERYKWLERFLERLEDPSDVMVKKIIEFAA